MTGPAPESHELDLGDLGLDRGGHLLIDRALAGIPAGGRLAVRGRDPALAVHLRPYCRERGHQVCWPEEAGDPVVVVIIKGSADDDRWRGAERAGDAGPGGAVDHPPASWGLAARGALVEAGAPAIDFPLRHKSEVWADEAARLYAQAAAAQWDPATAIDWQAPCDLPAEVEDAVVQVMTYLIENETAALVVPAGFLARVHPHFREVIQLLAIQTADEARHIEVFTRRALLRRDRLGVSTAGGQASLATLVREPDFALAAFLLSVLGEGSFLHLLWFLRDHAPDPITAQIARLAAQDEARHVAFGLAHLSRHLDHESTLRARLAAAVERRHDALQHTAGLNQKVFDALVLLAAGSWNPDAIEKGYALVQAMVEDMDAGRRRHLERLGFGRAEATSLSALHTRNFM